MDPHFRVWLIIVSLALISSITAQIFVMVIFIRLLSLARPASGRPGLQEIADRVFRAATSLEGVANAAGDTLEQVDREVRQVAAVSKRRLADADRVTGEVLTTVERINRSVDSVTGWPFREVAAWSAGLRTASMALFQRRHNSDEGKQG